MSLIRLRRLESDARALEALLREPAGRPIRVEESYGRPANAYRIRIDLPGVASLWTHSVDPNLHRRQGFFAIRSFHTVHLRFPAEYPFRPPEVAFVHGLFHPNVYPNGRLCWGQAEDDPRWWRGGEGLDVLLERLMQIIVGDPLCVNLRSPANALAVPSWTEFAANFPLARLAPRERSGAQAP